MNHCLQVTQKELVVSAWSLHFPEELTSQHCVAVEPCTKCQWDHKTCWIQALKIKLRRYWIFAEKHNALQDCIYLKSLSATHKIGLIQMQVFVEHSCHPHRPMTSECSGLLVDWEAAGSMIAWSSVSNPEQIANILCAQANSSSCPQRIEKCVVYNTPSALRDEALIWLTESVVSASCFTVQLSVSAGSEWPPHDALLYH